VKLIKIFILIILLLFMKIWHLFLLLEIIFKPTKGEFTGYVATLPKSLSIKPSYFSILT